MKPCEVCGRPGHKHHIVFRSQGGMDIKVNYAYLCVYHHEYGPEAVHTCRATDLRLKVCMQRQLESMFSDTEYRIEDIAKSVECSRKKLQAAMKAVHHRNGTYRREDIIRFFMGGKLYDDLGDGEELEREHCEWLM